MYNAAVKALPCLARMTKNSLLMGMGINYEEMCKTSLIIHCHWNQQEIILRSAQSDWKFSDHILWNNVRQLGRKGRKRSSSWRQLEGCIDPVVSAKDEGRTEGKEQNIGKNSWVINIKEMGVSKNTDTWHASLVLSRIHFSLPELQLHSWSAWIVFKLS